MTRSRTRREVLLGAAALAGTAALPRTASAQAKGRIVVGTWGGDYARLLNKNIEAPILIKDGWEVVQDQAGDPERRSKMFAEVRLPLLSADTRTGFVEFNRRAGDFAFAMAVVAYQVKDGKIAAPRIAVGGAEASPRRIAEAEAALAGEAADAAAFQAAGEAAAKAVDPLEDASIPQNYRRDLVRTMVVRALSEAA